MFGFGRRRKERFQFERRIISEEINRSERFGYGFVLLVVELSHTAPRGLSRIFPGRTISFHTIEKNLRSYDRVGQSALRRYHVLLPQTDRNQAKIIEERIHALSRKYNLGDVIIGSAVYPEDGKTAKALIDHAVSKIPSF